MATHVVFHTGTAEVRLTSIVDTVVPRVGETVDLSKLPMAKGFDDQMTFVVMQVKHEITKEGDDSSKWTVHVYSDPTR